jgi:hypothetical protein
VSRTPRPGFDLMTPDEVATELRVSAKTLANQRSAGVGLPFIRINGVIRYRRSDVVAELERNLVIPGGAA